MGKLLHFHKNEMDKKDNKFYYFIHFYYGYYCCYYCNKIFGKYI